MKNIFLIGFMGSGKTTVGKRLSERLSLPFFDIDEEVVKAAGKPIADIFAENTERIEEGEFRGMTRGELKFRNMETEALLRLCGGFSYGDSQEGGLVSESVAFGSGVGSGIYGAIISCGGGLALFERNVEILREYGTTIELCASAETVYERVKDDESRPLLRSDAAEDAAEEEKRLAKIEKAQEIMALRRLRYAEAADLVFATDYRTPDEVCEEIEAALFEPEGGKGSSAANEGAERRLESGRENESESRRESGHKGGQSRELPLICSPMVAGSAEEMLTEIRRALRLKKENPLAAPDILELRVDLLEGMGGALKSLLSGIKKLKIDEGLSLPLIATYRTEQPREAFSTEKTSEIKETVSDIKKGAKENDDVARKTAHTDGDHKYENVVKTLIESDLFDYIDIEIARPESRRLIAEAKRAGAKTIASKHDFERTPDLFEMINTFVKMQEAGADICKAAYMPREKAEVHELLYVAEMFSENYAVKPFIAISMGELGRESRLYKGNFLSFAALEDEITGGEKKTSAPGQLSVPELRKELSDKKSDVCAINVKS